MGGDNYQISGGEIEQIMKTFEEKKFDIWRGKHLVKGRRRRKTFKTNISGEITR